MMEQPCAQCDYLLDVNEDTCPRCGAPRRGRRAHATERPARWLRLRWLGAGALAGLVLAFAVWLNGTVDSGSLSGVFLLGVIAGGIVTAIVRLRESKR